VFSVHFKQNNRSQFMLPLMPRCANVTEVRKPIPPILLEQSQELCERCIKMSNTGTLPAPAESAGDFSTAAPAPWKFDALQRCDRCGAQAYIKATHKDYPHGLLFCGHHGNKVKDRSTGLPISQSLKSKGWDIDDQSGRLNENTKPDGGSAAG
jgi:hypothetical protein